MPTSGQISLTIGLFNARSICNKISSIVELNTDWKIDIVCLTKTWLKVRDKAKFREIHELGYDIYSKPRARRGGGIAFVFKSGLSIKQVKQIRLYHLSSLRLV